MAKDKKKKAAQSADQQSPKIPKPTFVFTKDNYKWMAIAFGVIILGFILMYGQTPDMFDDDGMKNTGIGTQIKITLAPIIILIGYGIGLYSIMKKPAGKAPE